MPDQNNYIQSTMRKKYLLLVVLLAIISCNKDVSEIKDPATAPAVSELPAQFDQKVLIESFTQTSCGQCPKADLIIDSLIRFFPGKIYDVAFHVEDFMADSNLIQSFSGRNYYDSVFNSALIYPSGIVSRKLTSLADVSPDLWLNKTISALSEIPSCGIALEAENIEGNTLSLTVHVGFSANMFGDYRIHAYVVEDAIVSNDSIYDQYNDFDTLGATPDMLSPLYHLGNPIHLYAHRYVLKKVLTQAGTGDVIPSTEMIAGNQYVVNYSINTGSFDMNDSYIIVFVDKHALTPTGHRIENVQRVKLGESKDWN